MANEKRLIDAVRYGEVLERYINAPHVKVFGKYSDGMQLAISTCIELLNSQRTVDAVEVVHGRWIRKPIGNYTGADEVCCSICGDFIGVVSSDTGFEEAVKGMNYCPNCGADMRERKDNERKAD